MMLINKKHKNSADFPLSSHPNGSGVICANSEMIHLFYFRYLYVLLDTYKLEDL